MKIVYFLSASLRSTICLVMAIVLDGYMQSPSQHTPTSSVTNTIAAASNTLTTPRLPTPIGYDIESRVKFLIETNGNCSLSCWWGITPGQTTWNEAEPYIDSLALEIPGPVTTGSNDLTYYPTRFPKPNSISKDDYLFAEIAVNKSGIIEFISSSATFSISSMLADYGVPSQICLNIVALGTVEYKIVLFYDSGTMLVLYGTDLGISDHFFNICTKDLSNANPQLWVWNPTTFRTFNDIGKFGVIPPLTASDWFRPLGEVSDIQPQSFYNIYIDPSTTHCITTPISDWIT